MKRLVTYIAVLVVLFSCTKYPNTPKEMILGEWEMQYFVEYGNDDVREDIPEVSSGRESITFREYKTDKFMVEFDYVNTLFTTCSFDSDNRIIIDEQWGGSEVYDATGWEDIILQNLAATTHWLVQNDTLYLLFNKNHKSYNALCLIKK